MPDANGRSRTMYDIEEVWLQSEEPGCWQVSAQVHGVIVLTCMRGKQKNLWFKRQDSYIFNPFDSLGPTRRRHRVLLPEGDVRVAGAGGSLAVLLVLSICCSLAFCNSPFLTYNWIWGWSQVPRSVVAIPGRMVSPTEGCSSLTVDLRQ